MKTKKVKKKRLNPVKVLILLLILYIIGYGIYYVIKEPIRNITINGNTLVSDATIIEAAGIKNYPSIFTLKKKTLINKIKSISLVDEVEIKKKLNFELVITIKEAKPLFLNKSTDQIMIGNGKYIENTNIVGIPTLINYTPEEILNNFALSLGKLDTGIISGISEIEYAPSLNEKGETIDETRFLLKMNDGNKVYTNTDKCSALKYYQHIYSGLNNKKGTLYLDSGNYDNYTFQEG